MVQRRDFIEKFTQFEEVVRQLGADIAQNSSRGEINYHKFQELENKVTAQGKMLHNLLNEWKNTTQTVDNLDGNVTQSRTEVEECKRDVNNLARQIGEIQIIKSLVDSIHKTLSIHEIKQSEFEAKLHTFEQLLAGVDTMLPDIKKVVNEVAAHQDALTQKINGTKEDLISRYNELDETLLLLKKEFGHFREDESKLETELTTTKISIEQLQDSIQDLKSNIDENKRLHTVIKNKLTLLDDTKFSRTDKELNLLKQQLDRLELNQNHLVDRLQEVANIKEAKTTQHLQTDIKSLYRSISLIKKHQEELAAAIQGLQGQKPAQPRHEPMQ